MKMNKITLSFPHDLEQEYQKKFFADSLKPFRIAFLCVIALYAMFGFLDNLIYAEAQPAFFQIRFGMVIPFLIAVTVLSYSKFFQRIWQILSFLALIIGGSGIIFMLIKLPVSNYYYSGMMLIFFAGYLFIKLRFILAAIAGWLLLIIFNIGFYYLTDWNHSVVITQNFFYISANVIGMFAAYHIEYSSRKEFYIQKELDEKKQKIEEANKNLEKRIEEKVADLKKSQEQYELAVNGSKDGIWDWDIEKNRYFLSATAKKNLGFEDEEVENSENAFSELVHPDDIEQVDDHINSYFEGKIDYYAQEFRMRHKNGSYRWILSRGEALRNENGEPYRMAGSHTDITIQKQMLTLLQKKSEILYNINEYSMKLTKAAYEEMFSVVYEEFSRIFKTKNMILFDYDNENGRLLANRDILSRFQDIDLCRFFSEEEFSLQESHKTRLIEERLIVIHSLPEIFAKNHHLTAFYEENETDWFMQAALINKRELIGVLVLAGSVAEPIPENDEILTFASVTASLIINKKAEKKLAVSEENYRKLVENANEGILVTIGESIVFCNAKLIEITGYDKELLCTLNMFELIHQEDREATKQKYSSLLKNKLPVQQHPVRVMSKTKEVKWLELSGVTIEWEGNPAILTFISDVTERKIANDKIKRSLQEKEILIQEIHHRVKNNLQMISSLVSMQARLVKDTIAKDQIKSVRDRIKAMAIVHEIVYNSKQLDELNTEHYIKNLCRHLQQSYHQKRKPVTVKVQAESVLMPLEMAVPCALMINELVTNAYKHAFTNMEKGTISIRFSLENDTYFLEVRDNGKGLSNDIKIDETESMGLKIIRAQVGQLKGELQVENKDGACFTIHFPYRPKREYLPNE